MGEKAYSLLLVDDDREVLHIHGEYLRRKGYLVYLAMNAAEALKVLDQVEVHCIVLDVMMPGMDGFEAIEALRKKTNAPVLFLTGRGAENDRIKGLSLGAEDYITKPCSLKELALRIQIRIRRSLPTLQQDTCVEFPPLRVNLTERKVFHEEEEIYLSNREYELLVMFVRNPGRELTFEEIGLKIYGTYLEEDRKNIMVTASRLRKKLEGYVGLEHMIETVWGKGYRFRGDL